MGWSLAVERRADRGTFTVGSLDQGGRRSSASRKDAEDDVTREARLGSLSRQSDVAARCVVTRLYMSDLVTLGESMAVMSSTQFGALSAVRDFELSIAGAESNVAIGISRLGRTATWIGRVGNDPFGEKIVRTLRGEGIEVVRIVDSSAPTGMMIKEHRTVDRSNVYYYRKGSAGSRLCAEDVMPTLFTDARIVHVTGITAGLSASSRKAVERAIELARSVGALVSFDVNYRKAVWTEDEAAPVLWSLASRSDVVFAGKREAALLGAGPGARRMAIELSKAWAARVVVMSGQGGAVAAEADSVVERTAAAVGIIDTIGAGDAFVAGFLHALLDGEGVDECLARGTATAGVSIGSHGDWEGLPNLTEVRRFWEDSDAVDR